MSAEQFPLLTRAGLIVRKEYGVATRDGRPCYIIDAADVERWLEQAPMVFSVADTDSMRWESTQFCTHSYEHTARLVLIEPLVRDTAEGLLRELVNTPHVFYDGSKVESFIERAKRLLGEGE